MIIADKITKIEDINLETSKEKLDRPKIIIKSNRIQKPLIEVKDLVKVYGHGKKAVNAVDHIDLEFYDEENVALLGANGAGKTTLIEMIAGLTKPSAGKILYNFKYHNSFQEKIGIQFQDSSYPVGLKVKNIIKFMLEVYDVKMSKQEVQHLVKMFGLDFFWNKLARSLSGGQQQRLNILLAILHRPKILFLDELSTGLDISVRQQIKIFVKQYCEKYKINIVLISHDVEEIELLCSRIVVMQKGTVKVDISKAEAVKQYGSVDKLLNLYI